MNENHEQLAPTDSPGDARPQEKGKVGLALLMWLLGVPGSIVLIYLLFAH